MRRVAGPVALAVIAGLVGLAGLVVLVAPGTLARWTDRRTLAVPAAGSGRLDVTVDGSLVGSGGSVTVAGLGLGDAVPGESVAVALTVANPGTAPFAWSATGTSTGDLAPSLLVSVHPGGTASTSGSAGLGTRRGSCSGTAVFGPAALGTAPVDVVAPARRLEPAASERVCVVVALAASAPGNAQGASASAAFVLTARQVRR